MLDLLRITLIATLFVAVQTAFADVPAYLLSSPNQPVIAVFAKGNEGFALGCEALAQRWSGVQIKDIQSSQWDAEMSKIQLVAHVHCDERTKKFLSEGEPGALVISHTDGKSYRHYVDDSAWFNAVSGSVEAVKPDNLVSQAPNRGVDFHSKIKLPPAPPADCVCATSTGNVLARKNQGCTSYSACSKFCYDQANDGWISTGGGVQVMCR